MKIIYMEQTLNLMAQQGPQHLEYVNDLVALGQIKTTEQFGNYLVIQHTHGTDTTK
jgi:hypothetical protein